MAFGGRPRLRLRMGSVETDDAGDGGDGKSDGSERRRCC